MFGKNKNASPTATTDPNQGPGFPNVSPSLARRLMVGGILGVALVASACRGGDTSGLVTTTDATAAPAPTGINPTSTAELPAGVGIGPEDNTVTAEEASQKAAKLVEEIQAGKTDAVVDIHKIYKFSPIDPNSKEGEHTVSNPVRIAKDEIITSRAIKDSYFIGFRHDEGGLVRPVIIDPAKYNFELVSDMGEPNDRPTNSTITIDTTGTFVTPQEDNTVISVGAIDV